MSLTKLERDKQKLIQDKCQQILAKLLRDEDNKYCVDCDSKGPRWASWNLGIFLCIRCAGIHRNLGVHISKVKSVNLDSWTPEQVGSIQNMGNSKARAVYEANLPDNFCRPQTDTALESFIRAKYEQKKYIAKEWVETSPMPAFDVEAELKKEKEKKKNKIKSISPIGTQSDIQSNSIPRPSATVTKTDKMKQIQQVNQQPKADSSQTTTDLLSLDLMSSTNEEPFGFFASAESSTVTSKGDEAGVAQTKETKTLEDEEKDFFSQKVPEKSEEKKLTKESILSLYSQAPSNTGLNGLISQPNALVNHSFTPVGANFGPANSAQKANMLVSTNPFLASSGNSTFNTDFQPSHLVPGLSSMQLNLTSSSGATPLVANTQAAHTNWFSANPMVSAQPVAMPVGAGQASSSLVNPFMTPVNNNNNNTGATANIANVMNNFDFKSPPTNSNTVLGAASQILPTTVSGEPQLLLGLNAATNQNEASSNLTNFW